MTKFESGERGKLREFCGKITIWKVLLFLGFMAVPLVGGFVFGNVLGGNNTGFYATVKKPDFAPPPIAFLPVWIILYILMGLASFIVAMSDHPKNTWLPLLIFYLHLGAGWAFNPVFFGLKSLVGAGIVMSIVTPLLLATLISFFFINKIASLMMVPVGVWEFYALALAWSIYQMN